MGKQAGAQILVGLVPSPVGVLQWVSVRSWRRARFRECQSWVPFELFSLVPQAVGGSALSVPSPQTSD